MARGHRVAQNDAYLTVREDFATFFMGELHILSLDVQPRIKGGEVSPHPLGRDFGAHDDQSC